MALLSRALAPGEKPAAKPAERRAPVIRPTNLVYAVDERPPTITLLVSALPLLRIRHIKPNVLLREDVAFFVARKDGIVAGCGGIQLYGRDYGELKRMYVRPTYRGRGLAQAMVDHLTAFAVGRDITLLRLETGIHQHAAIALYTRAGFRRVEPFGSYINDPFSVFFEKDIVLP